MYKDRKENGSITPSLWNITSFQAFGFVYSKSKLHSTWKNVGK